MADDDLIVADEVALLQHGLQRGEPDLVIAHRQIFRRVRFSRAKRDMSMFHWPGMRHRQRQCEGASFPIGVEHRLVRLRHDRAEAVHAAHVLRAVHVISFGCFGSPVPIMLSRVTSSASFSSLQPSVPAGRIGITR